MNKVMQGQRHYPTCSIWCRILCVRVIQAVVMEKKRGLVRVDHLLRLLAPAVPATVGRSFVVLIRRDSPLILAIASAMIIVVDGPAVTSGHPFIHRSCQSPSLILVARYLLSPIH